MKKFLQMALLLVVSLGFVSSVNAATEQELVDHVSKYYPVNGRDVRIIDKYIKVLKDILAEKEVSSEKAQRIIDDFDTAVSIMQAGKQTDPTKLSQSDKQRLLDLGKDAAAQLEINANYSNGVIKLTGFDGKSYPSVDVRNALEGRNGVLRPTGNDYTVYVAISGLALVGIAIIGYRKLKGNA